MGFELTTENMATILIDGSTILLLAGVFIDTSIMRKRGRDDDKLFFLMILFDIIMAIADIPSYLIDRREGIPGGRIINIGSMTVFYIAMVFLCMVWLHYCIVRFMKKESVSPKEHRWLFMPGLLTEIILLVNIFTGWIFYVDEANTYYHGVLFVPLFVVMGFYVLGGFYLIGRYRTGTDRRVLIPVWIYMLPLVVGLAVPFVYGGISLTSIGCGISIVFTHLGSASELASSYVEGGER